MFRPIALAAGIAVSFLVAAPSSAIEWKYSSWTPPPAPNNHYGTVPMFEMIQKETNGGWTFRNFMGAQLFNAVTTLAGVRDGAVDAGVTVPVYNAAELKAHVTISDLQALTIDGWSAAAAATETLLLDCPECLADYEKIGTLSLGGYAGAPYYLMCNSELGSMADLKGKKLGEGSAVFARWAATVGMSRIQMGPGDYLQGLQRGTVDCVAGPKEWLFSLSLRDAVKSVADNQSLGVVPSVSLMTVNKKSWDKLSAEHKKLMFKHMPLAIARAVNGYYANEKKGEDTARQKGVKFVSLGDAYVKSWDAFRASEPKAVIDAAKSRGVQSAEAIVKSFNEKLESWDEILDKKGRSESVLADEMAARIYSKLKL